MWLKNLYRRFRSRLTRTHATRRCRVRLILEGLEDRTVPASFTAASVPDLVADINAANLSGGPNTITLAPHAKFTLTGRTIWDDGLPVIAAGDDLTVLGNGDVIERSPSVVAWFRLFEVAAGASLTLSDLTLQGGYVEQQGGAIYNQGTLTLSKIGRAH